MTWLTFSETNAGADAPREVAVRDARWRLRRARATVAAAAVLVACSGGEPSLVRTPDGVAGAQTFGRTELYFGLSTPTGLVTDREFQEFVATEITPRFPDGFTVLPGSGQYRAPGGRLVVEPARLLILLVPTRDRAADAKVEAVRSAYKRRFQQQSVLRSDGTVSVSF